MSGQREPDSTTPDPSRRKFLAGGILAAGVAATAGVARKVQGVSHSVDHAMMGHGAHALARGKVSTEDFDPYAFLTRFDWGKVVGSTPGGGAIREYSITAFDKEIEIVPGVKFPAWTYNGQVPGPTIRANEGDRLRVKFVNAGSHPHTIHFHGIHRPEMDGVPGLGDGEILPGGITTYEFDANPHGLQLYHCHATPLKRHIHKGLYGAFIIDPKPDDPAAWGPVDIGPDGKPQEFVIVMNAFDTNFDNANEVYAANTKAFAYHERPIRVKKDSLVRIFLVNLTEFDLINSLHLHANFFNYWDTGRKDNPKVFTDTVALTQGQRGIVEARFPFPGKYMFHAHQSEFAELGWMSFFEVVE